MNWGMNGLWLGPTVAIIFNFIFYYLFIVKTNWDKVMEDSKQAREKEKNKQ